MNYNVCKYCGAKDGRAGLLTNSPILNIENACENCYDTLVKKTITIHCHLIRTHEEIDKTFNLLK
jgi:NAD kinase